MTRFQLFQKTVYKFPKVESLKLKILNYSTKLEIESELICRRLKGRDTDSEQTIEGVDETDTNSRCVRRYN